MADWTVWWMLAGAVVALELLTGTFFLLMLALGLAAGAVAAHAGAPLNLQLVVAAVVGGGAIVAWQRWRSWHPLAQAETTRDVNLDIGQQVQVEFWQEDGTTKVRYRGADWEARIVQAPPPAQPLLPGRCVIVAIEGSHLLLRPL